MVRFAYLWHVIGQELVFLSFLYIKLFELGVEVAFNNRSAVTHYKINLLKFPLRAAALSAPMKPRENGSENRFLSRVRSTAKRECEP